MSTKHLKLNPHKIRGTDTAWWYEEEQGICVVVEPNVQTRQIVIPWKALSYALKRKARP